MSRSKENWFICMFMLGIALLEIHSIAKLIDPSIAITKVDWFLSPTHKEVIEIQWYLKFLFSIITPCILLFTTARLMKGISKRVMWVCDIGLCYYFIDLLMFIWNFQITTEVYWIVTIGVLIGGFILLFKKFKLKAV